ncbi:hypothetical protein CWV51_23585 [Salmonella enterica]|nr:hypothetical protein [Salmonella enterica subsp. diarizonae]EDJ9767322.1 hypothetical protein [Salmonella enterica]EDL5588744.1 hypothetical protein [Salmonella enterica]
MPPGINIGRNVSLAADIQIIRPPLHHSLAGVEVFGAMDIRRPHAVAFLMAHLPLHRIPRPEFRFHQCATGHCPEAMPANVGFGIVTHQT